VVVLSGGIGGGGGTLAKTELSHQILALVTVLPEYL
jgi:hypothetical protein